MLATEIECSRLVAKVFTGCESRVYSVWQSLQSCLLCTDDARLEGSMRSDSFSPEPRVLLIFWRWHVRQYSLPRNEAFHSVIRRTLWPPWHSAHKGAPAFSAI